MDALTPVSSSDNCLHPCTISVGSRPTRIFGIAVTIGLIMTTGCKTGNPLEHAVRVTQQPSGNSLADSPRTRLNPFGKTDPAKLEADDLDAAGIFEGEASDSDDDSLSSQYALTEPMVKARKTAAAEQAAGRQAGKAALSGEYQELMAAFKDSPPEVQQQALRQLLAVSARNAARTESPAGINKALKSSIDRLPTLSDEWPEPEQQPVRLASGTSSDSDQPDQQTSLAVLQQPIESEQSAGKKSSPQAQQRERNEEAAAEQLETQVDEPEHDAEQADGTPSVGSRSRETSETIQQVSHESEPQSRDTLPAKSQVQQTAEVTPEAQAPSIESLSEEQLYAELIRRQQAMVAGESDADRYRRELIARHLTLFSGDPDAAVEPIDEMGDREQEFLRHQLLGLWTMIDQSGHPVATRRWSAAVPEFREAMRNLASAAESLEVNSLAFCSEIQSFGQVTKFPTSRFSPGQKVILYCEVDNFVSESNAAGYETQLQGSYEVFDSKGQKVAGQVLPADTQTSATALRDYFIAYQMGLPSGLPAGSYQLTLTMECQKGKKYGRATIPFEIATK